MTTVIRGFRIENSQPKRSWGPSPWLRIADDTRPRCVLVVGDGFSRGFLYAHGITENFPSGVDQHFNLADSTTYKPLPGDCFGPHESKFWDVAKWPLVIAKWGELEAKLGKEETRGRDFYNQVVLESLNEDRQREQWTFRTKNLNYELRCYLWHLFHSLDIDLGKRLHGKTLPWQVWRWFDMLWYFLAEFRFSAISFNYDLVLENALMSTVRSKSGLSHSMINWFVEEPDPPVDNYPITAIPIYKIHGGIQAYLNPNYIGAGFPNDPEQCPWKLDLEFEKNLVTGARTLNQWVRTSFPLLPDIVPPGRPGFDICNPYSQVNRMSKAELSRADVVVFCGLSAAQPDTDEVRELVSHISKHALIFQVGLRAYGDDKNPLAELLNAQYQENTKFVDASDVISILPMVQGRFPSRNDWTTHISK